MNKNIIVIGIIFLLVGASVVSSTGYIARESNPIDIYYKMDPPTVLLDENFSGTFPPEGWETGFFDQNDSSCCDSEPPCARGKYSGQYYDNYIKSKAIDASNYEKCIIKFYFGAQPPYGSYSNVYLKYRRNETSPWIDISPWTNPIGDVCEFYETEITYDPEGCGEALQIKWLYIGWLYYLHNTCLDDIKILGIPIDNQPPNKPEIDGPTSGKVGVEYEYTFNSTDDGHDFYYLVDWGDNSPYEIVCLSNPDGSGIAKANHSWNTKGTYIIRARTRDVFGAESDWAYLEVTMPKNKPFIFNSLFIRFLQNHPNLFPLLRNLLGV